MEVVCDLLKGPVYLAGEEVTCLITFSNNSTKTLSDQGTENTKLKMCQLLIIRMCPGLGQCSAELFLHRL